ncbi:MAG TPA: hypothetical protein VFH17_04545, partial [Coriobacteriia bacterium]|nr:hypothetical protein [Coriobacteriia bacterium]
PKGVTASYRWLCRGVEAAFCALGFDARITRRPRGSAAASACYLHAARADLSVGTRKLSGAAQVWMGHAVLQHGSFVLSRDVEREATAFRMDEGERAAFAGTVVTLSARRQGVPTRHEVIEAIRRGFAQALGITFCECALSHVETERAREFARAAADHTRRA